MRALAALLPLVFLFGGNDFATGVRAYEEGRYREALDAFTAAELAVGNEASAALVFNRALAALRVGEVRVAEFSAEKAAARGGPAFVPLRDFLLGNAAWLVCQRAEAEAGMREADPTAFGRAITACLQARDHWQRAATSRDDWPEARRNVERAVRKLAELERAKAEAERNREARQAGRTEDQPVPDPVQPPDQPGVEVEQDPVAQQDPSALSPDDLERLLARLEQVERDKRALRRARQRAQGSTVERDW